MWRLKSPEKQRYIVPSVQSYPGSLAPWLHSGSNRSTGRTVVGKTEFQNRKQLVGGCIDPGCRMSVRWRGFAGMGGQDMNQVKEQETWTGISGYNRHRCFTRRTDIRTSLCIIELSNGRANGSSWIYILKTLIKVFEPCLKMIAVALFHNLCLSE